jgi:hypothetical protein
MPGEGAIIFRELVGKLDVINVECDKCADMSAWGWLDRAARVMKGLDDPLARIRI